MYITPGSVRMPTGSTLDVEWKCWLYADGKVYWDAWRILHTLYDGTGNSFNATKIIGGDQTSGVSRVLQALGVGFWEPFRPSFLSWTLKHRRNGREAVLRFLRTVIR